MLLDYKITYGSDIVVLIKVGLGGSTDGHNGKYAKMAEKINQKTGYTVIVAPNPEKSENKLEKDMRAIETLFPRCQEIHFIGVSNGAVIGMLYAHLYEKIKDMLLINGPLAMDWHKLKQGIGLFHGNSISFVYGSKDPSYKYSELIPMIKAEAEIGLHIVDGADHNFTGMEDEFVSLPCTYLFCMKK